MNRGQDIEAIARTFERLAIEAMQAGDRSPAVRKIAEYAQSLRFNRMPVSNEQFFDPLDQESLIRGLAGC